MKKAILLFALLALTVSLIAFEAVNLPVNTSGLERMPWLCGDTLYFVGDNYDIYQVQRLADGSWGERELVPGDVNTSENEISPCVIKKDGVQIMYFARYSGKETDYDFFRIEYDEATRQWKNAVKVPELSTDTQDWDIWVNCDETLAYLTTKGTFGGAAGVGKRDVWKSEMVDGRWQTPVLVSEVSSEVDEWSVFVDPSGKIWVDGARDGAYGSYDIYYYDPALKIVVHVGRDISSIYNDRSIWTDGETLIFTSADRPAGQGGYDLYITDLGEE